MTAPEHRLLSPALGTPGSLRLRFLRATRSWLGLALVSLLLAWPPSGLAAGEPSAGEVQPQSAKATRRAKGMCKEDAARLCPDVEPAQRHRCLSSRRDELSPPCLEQVQNRSERGQKMLALVTAACADDIASRCGSAAGPSAVGCLMSHYGELEPDCRQVLPQRQSK